MKWGEESLSRTGVKNESREPGGTSCIVAIGVVLATAGANREVTRRAAVTAEGAWQLKGPPRSLSGLPGLPVDPTVCKVFGRRPGDTWENGSSWEPSDGVTLGSTGWKSRLLPATLKAAGQHREIQEKSRQRRKGRASETGVRGERKRGCGMKRPARKE